MLQRLLDMKLWLWTINRLRLEPVMLSIVKVNRSRVLSTDDGVAEKSRFTSEPLYSHFLPFSPTRSKARACMRDRLETLSRWKWESFHFQLLENHRDTSPAIRAAYIFQQRFIKKRELYHQSTENYRGYSTSKLITSHHFDNFLLWKVNSIVILIIISVDALCVQ